MEDPSRGQLKSEDKEENKLRLPSVAVQYAAGITAGMSAAAAGAWLSWPSSALTVLQQPDFLHLNDSEISTLVALMDLGNVLSPIPCAYVMDSVGRKLTLLFTACIYITSFVLAIIGSNVWMFYIARLLAGIGKGIAFAVTPVYLGEIADKRLRGALSTFFIGLLNFGMCFDYFYGYFVKFSLLNWFNLAIPVFFLSTFWLFPESPYYLLMKGRDGSAKKSLDFYRWINQSNPSEKMELEEELENTRATVERDMQNKSRFIDVFHGRGNRRALFIIVMLAIFQRLSGISPTLAYSTRILPVDGGGMDKHIYMIVFSFLLLGANFAAIKFVEKSGRKQLLIWSALTSAIAMGAAGIYYYLERDGGGETIRWVPYASMLMFAVTYSYGIGFLPSTLVAELFPTNVRSHAGSISAILLAATSFSVNFVFLQVREWAGVHVMFAIFSVSSILCVFFVIFFVFETKGKSLQEIQDILNKKGSRPV